MSVFDPSKYKTLTGSEAAELLTGTDGNDLIDGAGGVDTLTGGKGNDAYIVSHSAAIVVEVAGEGVDSVEATVSYSLAANIENLYLAEKIGEDENVVKINGIGNSLNNYILGNSADNVIDGVSGKDTLVGGLGNDTYILNDLSAIISEKKNQGIDTVQTSDSYALSAYIENLILTGNGNFVGLGSDFNNVITGNAGNNYINAKKGNDTIYGGIGYDTIYAGAGNDYIDGGANDDVLLGEDGNDTIYGGVGANYLAGGKGNDVLHGNGSDTLDGGANNDVYVVKTTTDTIIDSGGVDTIVAYLAYMLLQTNIERLTLEGVLDIDGNGNYLSNVLIGNIGNNTLDGKEGNDNIYGGDGNDFLVGGYGNDILYGENGDDTLTGGNGLVAKEQNKLYGGIGNDTYVVNNVKDIVYEGVNQGVDLVQSYVYSYGLASNVDNMQLMTNAVIGNGNNLNNTITGNSYDNVINGGAGADTLVGAAGNDTYYVDNIGDVVTELADEGTDSVVTSSTYTLAANVENLYLSGKYNINGVGNALDNVIYGNISNNLLDGKAGNDTIYAGKGDDIVYGGLGNDVLYGELGNDTYKIASGDGNDTIVDAYGGTVVDFTDYNFTDVSKIAFNLTNPKSPILTVWIGSQVIEVNASLSPLLKFMDNIVIPIETTQRFVSTNSAASFGNDVIFYNATIIDGREGNDILVGGNNTVSLVGGVGNDVLVATNSNETLYGDIDGSAVAGNDTLYGNGSSSLVGGYGHDNYIVRALGDDIVEEMVTVTDKKGRVTNVSGIDTVVSYVNYDLTTAVNVENLTLVNGALTGVGNELNNVITGNDGDNTLDGKAGADALIGGAGNDTYYVDNSYDVVSEQTVIGTKNKKPVYGDSGGEDNVISTTNYALSAYVENLTLTEGSAVFATGNNLNNTIVGNSGANTINGGAGVDTLVGGDGADVYVVDNSSDVITETTVTDTDSVLAYANYTLSTNVENITLMGKAHLQAVGNSLDNIMVGNAGNNYIDGAAGNDTIYAGSGNDVIIGGTGNDYIDGGAGNDTYYINNNDGVDTIVDTSGNNTIVFGDLNFNQVNVVSYNTSNKKYPILTLEVSPTQTITINGSTSTVLRFADGISVPIKSYSVYNFYSGYGTSSNDFISYNSFVLDGGKGNDIVIGGSNTSIAYGGVGNDIIVATADAETLEGGDGNDTLYGYNGASVLNGGKGNDTYVISSDSDTISDLGGIDRVLAGVTYSIDSFIENLTLIGTDNIIGTGNVLNNVIVGNVGSNVIFAQEGNDYVDGGVGNDSLYGGDGNDSIYGSDGEDVLDGEAGKDILYGGNGNDTLIGDNGAVSGDFDKLYGGFGDDTYIITSLSNAIYENAGQGVDSVRSSVSFTLGNNLENITLTGIENINATGNNLNNYIIGNYGNNTINGAAGSDTLVGSYGDDNYIIDSTEDVIMEYVGEGTDSVTSSINYTLDNNIENLVMIGKYAVNGVGNTLDNSISGTDFANVISGNSGNDTISSAGGNDTVYGDAGNDSIDGGDGDDRIYGGDGDDSVSGGKGNDLVFGDDGNDTLVDSAGADSLIGGVGNDTYIINSSQTLINENDAEGTDVVVSSITYTLGNYVENLTLTGTSDIDGIGNALNNTIVGNDADNILEGKGGDDTLIGGAGDDVYIIDAISDVVVEGSNSGTDTVQTTFSYNLVDLNLTNIENITLLNGVGLDTLTATGNDANNYLTGNNGTNSLYGGLGDDTLDGAAGADYLVGGNGDDSYYIDTVADTIVETPDYDEEGVDISGSDTVYVYYDNYTLSSTLENLTLMGSVAYSGTGNEFDNKIIGNSLNNTLVSGDGNDTIDGGAGIDSMLGGLGNDVYTIDVSGDRVLENASEGDDTVIVKFNNYSLGNNLENLIMKDSAASATANNLNNYIEANALDNNIKAGAGSDIIVAAEGNDTVAAEGGIDLILGGEGDDVYNIGSGDFYDYIFDSNGNDTIFAYAHAVMTDGIENAIVKTSNGTTVIGNGSYNYILGGAGNDWIHSGNAPSTEDDLKSITADTLDGGAGADTLVGGLGRNIFRVDDKRDVIQDSDYSTDWGDYRKYGIEHFDFDTIEVGLKDYGYANLSSYQSMSSTYTIGDSVTAYVTITSTGKVNVVGNDMGLTIIGNENINIIKGGDGDDHLNGHGVSTANSKSAGDTLIGGFGDDDYILVGKNDVAIEYANQGYDRIQTIENCNLNDHHYFESIHLMREGLVGWGTSRGNQYSDSNGDDTLSGVGNDTLYGRSGDDTYYNYKEFQGAVSGEMGDITAVNVFIENANEGTDEVYSALSYTLAANIENLYAHKRYIYTDALVLTGNNLNNEIIGNIGNNTIDGSTGADTMTGLDGNDVYYVDNADDVVIEDSVSNTSETAPGTDTVNASISYTLGDNLENLILLGTANLNGAGNDAANSITGNTGRNIIDAGGGNDTIDGGGGNDTIYGGDGDDVYKIDNSNVIIYEYSGEGASDIVNASVTYTLGENIEIFNLNGEANINGTANSSDNTITGNVGANIINGAGGNDTIKAGEGNDTIYGGDGDDSIEGEGGIDYIYGGDGNDTLVINDILEVNKVSGGTGVDLVVTSVDFTLSGSSDIENISLGGSGAINAFGNASGNTITGNSSANTIDGGGGADTIITGGGGDTIIYRDTYNLSITASANDTLLSYASDYTNTSDTVVNIVLATGAGAINASGRTIGEYLKGNEAINTLSGGDGNDTIEGGGGEDVLIGGDGNDTYIINNDFAITITEEYQDLPATEDEEKENEDTVESYVAMYTLHQHVENLILKGTLGSSGYGNELGNSITGNTGMNYLVGGDGNDTIDGGGNSDTLLGGTGDDTFIIDNAGIIVSENTNEGTDEIKTKLASFDLSQAMYFAVENLTLVGETAGNAVGNALDNKITGNDKNNLINGGLSNDTLDGGGGQDTLIGGLGDDTYVIDSINVSYVENAGEGTDTVEAKISYTISENIENLKLYQDPKNTISGADINGTGNAGDNTILGNAGHNTLDGAGGIDTLIGGLGNDTYIVYDLASVVTENSDAGNDTIHIGGSYNLTGTNIENVTLLGTGDFTITGTDVDNKLIGNAGDNTITGGAGNDTIDGGGSSVGDKLIGGDGDDTYYVYSASDSVTELDAGGKDTVISTVSFSLTGTLPTNLEHLTLAGSSNINATGNDGHNTLIGNSGNNTIVGGAGNDTIESGGGVDSLVGGSGDDTYTVNDSATVIQELVGEGTDVVNSSVSYTLLGNIEQLILTGEANINGYGNAGINTITGNAGNNTIDGGGDADILDGGAGDDTYIVSDSAVSITDSSGTDTVRTALTDYTLTDGIENIVLLGAIAHTIVANELANTISGFVDGDMITGDLGGDTYIIDSAVSISIVEVADIVLPEGATEQEKEEFELAYKRDVALVSIDGYTLADNVEKMVLLGASNFTGYGNSIGNTLVGNIGNNILDGGNGNDSLLGGAGNDTLYGGNGNDTLIGGIGIDSLIGGDGDDTYYYDNVDIIVEQPGGGSDTIVLNYSYSLQEGSVIENITFTGTANVISTGNSDNNKLVGNDGMNILDGGAGNDTLDGGLGIDLLIGGSGNDTYYIDEDDKIVEILDSPGYTGGIDTVFVKFNYTIDDYSTIEHITLDGDADINSQGNSYSNILIGNKGNNTIVGGGGNDTIKGEAGNDNIDGGLGNDTIDGGAGDDNIQGGSGNDTIYGGIGGDVLDGGNGNDTIIGGFDDDILFGGSGNDTYELDEGDGVDFVLDSSGSMDIIRFGDNVDKSKIAFFRDEDGNLMVKYADDDQVFISDDTIERFYASDGTYLDASDVNQMIQNIDGFNDGKLENDPTIIKNVDDVYANIGSFTTGITWT